MVCMDTSQLVVDNWSHDNWPQTIDQKTTDCNDNNSTHNNINPKNVIRKKKHFPCRFNRLRTVSNSSVNFKNSKKCFILFFYEIKNVWKKIKN